MKKLLFVLAAVGFLAASCSGQSQAPSGGSADNQAAPLNTQGGSQNAPQAMASDVKVSGVDDAVNVLEKNSTNEQSKVSASDDSDLTSSDSADLGSLTGVSNGY